MLQVLVAASAHVAAIMAGAATMGRAVDWAIATLEPAKPPDDFRILTAPVDQSRPEVGREKEPNIGILIVYIQHGDLSLSAAYRRRGI
jgi:hypothetical protein